MRAKVFYGQYCEPNQLGVNYSTKRHFFQYVLVKKTFFLRNFYDIIVLSSMDSSMDKGR